MKGVIKLAEEKSILKTFIVSFSGKVEINTDTKENARIFFNEVLKGDEEIPDLLELEPSFRLIGIRDKQRSYVKDKGIRCSDCKTFQKKKHSEVIQKSAGFNHWVCPLTKKTIRLDNYEYLWRNCNSFERGVM